MLFCYDQEPLIPEYNKLLFDNRFTSRAMYQPVILLNTERNSLPKNQILENYGFIDCYYFFHVFAATDWYRSYRYSKFITSPSERKIKKKFITFNRLTGGARTYRSIFVGELVLNDLLDHGYVSYSDICEEHGHFATNLDLVKRLYKLDGDYIKLIHSTLDTLTFANKFPLRIDHINKPSIPNGSQTLSAVHECMESFLHVVTETCFWETKEHLTEKIFKPIVAKQPFALLGCANNLKYLKDYGFKTFDRWWDESYDTIEDPVQRIQAVVKIIKDICSKSNFELEDMLKDMQHVLDYNYNWFYSREFVDTAWYELEINLRAAIAQQLPQISQGT